MPLYRIEGPDNEEVLPLDDMKSWLRVDFDDDDDLIQGMIDGAIQHLDGRDGWLNRALGPQTWELRIDEFSFPEIMIPLPPLISVDSIKYYDDAGVEQTLSPTVYQVCGVGGQNKGSVSLRYGSHWPTTDRRREAISIRFQAGYNDESAVPAPIITSLKRIVASMYETRESVVIGQTVIKLPGGVESNLAPYRVW